MVFNLTLPMLRDHSEDEDTPLYKQRSRYSNSIFFMYKERMIRNAEEKDAEALSCIYNHYIENTVITFEEETVETPEMAGRIDKIRAEYPWLVWEENGEILGYAYASRWRERTAYRFACELTVYLHHEATGRGIGRRLYSRLVEELKLQGMHSLLGCLTLPNPASEKLHAGLGFEKVAHFHEAGYKFGRWLDVGYFEKLI